MSTATMGKKRAASGAKKQAAAAEPGPRRTVLTIKGTDEWRGWLDRLSKFLRTPTSTIVDHALVKYAKDQGFDEPPPER